MKKAVSVFLSAALMAALFSGTGVSAAKKDISVKLDGSLIEFDVKPEIIDGRTMVPLRRIFEEIGALVKWDNDTKTVSARKNSKTVTLTVDSTDLQIDKGKTDDEGNPIVETVALEVPAQIVSGRTLVPARAISESFGLNVDWDEDNRTVVISSDTTKDDSWKENVGSINLSDLTYEGDGIEIKDNQVKITKGGDFTLTGTLKDGNITVSAKEKVKLRLSGVNITSVNNPCIFVEKADKAYITLTGGAENYLVAENAEDGALYSKENLEIKGDGKLDIKSEAGHGIKASDNLNIENGNIIINAASDGIHINDTFKMTGGVINITAIGDGIDSESIVNISGGKIDIETNGTPVQTTQTTQEATQQTGRRPMWENAAEVEFEKSTKGINAEWMMVISGGEINVNSASHAIHCEDEIQISGGKFTLSSKYEKGISAHGNLTISGSETSIDIAKSTEGIESKNVLTINDGVIKVVSTDDALNATGGSSGMMPPGGNFGGNFGGNGGAQNGNAQPSAENSKGTGANTRPNGGRRGQQGSITSEGENSFENNLTPPFELPANGNFTPPEMNGEAGSFAPTFEIPENGEFTPPTDRRPQMTGGAMAGGGFMGGGRNMKECLIINGGYIEACGSDDCIDANGNLTINGGTVKATNPTGAFTGNFGVLDADGKITVAENANIILASSSGRSLGLKQNEIIVYCENTHEAGEKITISDSKGNTVLEYAPDGGYKTVLIASNEIKTGEIYKITIGNEAFEAEIAGQSTVIGTQPSGGGMGFGRGPMM